MVKEMIKYKADSIGKRGYNAANVHNALFKPKSIVVGGSDSQSKPSGWVLANTQVTEDFSIKGDVNSDGAVNLADAIMALQVISRMITAQTVNKVADVNGDDKIGMAEVLYIMQNIAGMR